MHPQVDVTGEQDTSMTWVFWKSKVMISRLRLSGNMGHFQEMLATSVWLLDGESKGSISKYNRKDMSKMIPQEYPESVSER